MSYSQGSVVEAAHYNSLAGLTGTAAGSSAAATAIAGYLYGIGYGDRGYGQTSPGLTAISVGRVDKAWSNLQTVLADLCAWQNTSTTKLPSAAQMGSGADIVAYPTGETLSLPDLLTLVDTSRLSYVIGNMSISSGTTDTRSTSWGSGSGNIVSTLLATWSTEDKARYYFNTGSQLRFTLAHTATGTSQDSNWNATIDGLCIGFNAHSATIITTPSGGAGTLTSFGFYELTTTYQTLYTGVGTGAYASNTVLIEARSQAITGSNGGNGVTVQMRVTLTDNHTGVSDTVSSGTTNNMASMNPAAGLNTLPSAPTITVVTAFG